MGYTHSGATIYQGMAQAHPLWKTLVLTTDTAFNPTGLPVGRRVAVWLKIKQAGPDVTVAAKPTDDVGDFYSGIVNGRGGSYTWARVGNVSYIRTVTDVLGQVDVTSTLANAINIYLVGWAEIQSSMAALAAGLVPAAFANLDTGIGTRGWVLLRCEETAGSERYAVRPDGDVGDYYTQVVTGGTTQGQPDAGRVESYSLETSAAGIIEERAGGALNANRLLQVYARQTHEWGSIHDIIFAMGVAPTIAFTALDTGLGRREMVVLRVHREPIVDAGFMVKLGFRPADDSDDYLDLFLGRPEGTTSIELDADGVGTVEVETDALGIIEWKSTGVSQEFEVELIGVFNAPPVVIGTDPTPGAIEVEADAHVIFTATDTGDGIAQATLALDLTSPSAVVHNVLAAGIWDVGNGYSGALNPSGLGNFAPALTHHPDFEAGLWQADAYAEDTFGAFDADTWTFTVGGMALVSIVQSSTNSVDVTFDEEPLHLDPSNPQDGLYLAAYAVTGPVSPMKVRLIWGAEYIGDNTIRLYFDGDLVRDETYTITITGLKSLAGYLLIVPATGSFLAYGVSILPVSLLREIEDSYDLHNPQTASEAGQHESLGTLSADESGDLSVENRRSSLKKRVIRRCTTKPGGFAHLKDYGLRIDSKALLRPSDLRKLQFDAEDQVSQEPDVRSVRATVSQILPGVIQLSLRVVDRYGPIEIQTLLGGD